MIHNVSLPEIALPLVIIHDAVLQPLSHPLVVGFVGSSHGLVELEAVKLVLMTEINYLNQSVYNVSIFKLFY